MTSHCVVSHCVTAYHREFIVSQHITGNSLCHSVSQGIHCVTVYHREFIVSQRITGNSLCHSVSQGIHCVTAYHREFIVSQCITGNWLNIAWFHTYICFHSNCQLVRCIFAVHLLGSKHCLLPLFPNPAGSLPQN